MPTKTFEQDFDCYTTTQDVELAEIEIQLFFECFIVVGCWKDFEIKRREEKKSQGIHIMTWENRRIPWHHRSSAKETSSVLLCMHETTFHISSIKCFCDHPTWNSYIHISVQFHLQVVLPPYDSQGSMNQQSIGDCFLSPPITSNIFPYDIATPLSLGSAVKFVSGSSYKIHRAGRRDFKLQRVIKKFSRWLFSWKQVQDKPNHTFNMQYENKIHMKCNNLFKESLLKCTAEKMRCFSVTPVKWHDLSWTLEQAEYAQEKNVTILKDQCPRDLPAL